MVSESEEAKVTKVIIEVLGKHDYVVESEDLDEWLEIIRQFNQKVPACHKCGRPLETRHFVDSWDGDDKPSDVNEDYYCPTCKLRHATTPPPHQILTAT